MEWWVVGGRRGVQTHLGDGGRLGGRGGGAEGEPNVERGGKRWGEGKVGGGGGGRKGMIIELVDIC